MGSAGRDMVADLIRSCHEALTLEAYVITSESYFMITPPDTDIEKIKNEGISENPERKECLMMVGGTTEGTIVKVWMMVRGEDGKVSTLEEYSLPDAFGEGRFHDLLVTRKVC
jgi:hypothetical protein